MNEPLLSVMISAEYSNKTRALDGLVLDIARGEVLGLVGQSGCGKSTLALAILKLLHLRNATAKGFIRFQGRDLMPVSERYMRSLRGKDISLVLQSAMSALNPVLRIGRQLDEAWNVHRQSDKKSGKNAILQALQNVSLPGDPEFLRRYPSQISVGQAQRVLIAMATLHRPALLIADEPTSALDVITQAEILQLFADLSRKLHMGILFISHDLLAVASISQRVAVMQNGTIVECRQTASLFSDPHHPYTIRMMAALPAQPAFPVENSGPVRQSTGRRRLFESCQDSLGTLSVVHADFQETCP